MESKLKHLEMIQAIINRMAANSFLLKGWSITLIAALFALAAKDTEDFFIYIAYFPCLMFWYLDGYFLHQERMYRKLFSTVKDIDPNHINFDMNAKKYKGEVDSLLATCFSSTLRIFHGTILFVIILVMFLLRTIGS